MSNSSSPVVLITGCAFHTLAENKWVWGDLWKVGDTYVFNAVTNDKGEAAWQYVGDKPLPSYRSTLVVVGNYFERRAVLVTADAYLNAIAQEYLRGQTY